MKRRQFLSRTAAAGLITAASGVRGVIAQQAKSPDNNASVSNSKVGGKLPVPEKGRIPVAFVISEGVTVIDFTGPWEVFQDVMLSGPCENNSCMPFELFTVSDQKEPVTASAGLKIVPDFTFETAPRPKIVVVPAQGGRSPVMLDWLRKTSQTADVTMSVCTGAFVLARAGLLNGKSATTHHDFTERLAREYPEINVKRGLRFIEGEKISTAGGLTSGIDLALRVVERYFGRDVAQTTATYMEYQGRGWVV